MQQIARKATLTTKQLKTALALFRLGECKRIVYFRTGVINSNYVVTATQGKFVIRVYTLKSRQEVESELFMLRALRRRGFPCPEPVGPVFMVGSHPVCCFRYIEGRTLHKVTPDSLRRIGTLLARMHLLTEGMHLPHRCEGEGVAVIQKYLKAKKRLILKSRFKNSVAFIRFLERELADIRIPTGLPRGIIHADVKPENIIVGARGQLWLIDFDNAYVDALVMDIGSTISWLCLTGERLDMEKVKKFLRAYDLVRRISDRERSSIMECVRFTFLKHAFKYAYICLPKLKFAEHQAQHFVMVYTNVIDANLAIKQ